VRNRVVLVSDAGHVATPMTGAGFRTPCQTSLRLRADREGCPGTASPQV
jgi:2-polyprenyl-6-methoxyphenol hydroxylase-like FAD-dependent oxidoreductase